MIWLTLSTCGKQAPSAGNVNTQKADQSVSFTKSAFAEVQTDASITHLKTDFENVKSIISHITFGIIKLDDIALAVTKNQATALQSLRDQYVRVSRKKCRREANQVKTRPM